LDSAGTTTTWSQDCHQLTMMLKSASRLYSQQTIDASQFVATVVRAIQDYFLDNHGLCLDSCLAECINYQFYSQQPEPRIDLGYHHWTQDHNLSHFAESCKISKKLQQIQQFVYFT
jgi:hypothetical protein